MSVSVDHIYYTILSKVTKIFINFQWYLKASYVFNFKMKTDIIKLGLRNICINYRKLDTDISIQGIRLICLNINLFNRHNL